MVWRFYSINDVNRYVESVCWSKFFWKQPGGIESIPRGNSWNKLIDGIWNTIIFSINTFEGHDCIRIVIMTILAFELYSYVHFALFVAYSSGILHYWMQIFLVYWWWLHQTVLYDALLTKMLLTKPCSWHASSMFVFISSNHQL